VARSLLSEKQYLNSTFKRRSKKTKKKGSKMKKVNYQIEEKGIYIKYSLLVPNMKKVWQLLNNDLPKVGAVNITIEAVK
jgi:hypothetical protein